MLKENMADILHFWGAFGKEPELGLIQDGYCPAGRPDNATLFESAHDANSGLCGSPCRVSDFLPGKWQAFAELRGEHEQCPRDALFNPFACQVSEAVLGFPEPTSQNVDNPEGYLRMGGNEGKKLVPFDGKNFCLSDCLG